jgi:hypothetical protein
MAGPQSLRRSPSQARSRKSLSKSLERQKGDDHSPEQSANCKHRPRSPVFLRFPLRTVATSSRDKPRDNGRVQLALIFGQGDEAVLSYCRPLQSEWSEGYRSGERHRRRYRASGAREWRRRGSARGTETGTRRSQPILEQRASLAGAQSADEARGDSSMYSALAIHITRRCL